MKPSPASMHLLAFVCLGTAISHAAAPPPDLSEYRTVKTAVTTTISKTNLTAAAGQSGFLGINVAPDKRGKLIIADIAADSPAEKAGLQTGDLLLKFRGQPVASAESLREMLQAKSPGDAVLLNVERKGKKLELTAMLGAVSRPRKLGEERAVMGVTMGEAKDDEGVPISSFTFGSAAQKAGMKTNDLLVKIDGTTMTSSTRVSEQLSEKKPGDVITVIYKRDGKETEVKVTLAADRSSTAGQGTGAEFRTIWKKDLYRLAIIGVEFPDAKHNEGIPTKEWEQAMFSRSTYTKTNVSGATVYGSMNDYYLEQSCGALKVDGKAFNWVEIGKKRAEYSTSASQQQKSAFFNEALDALTKRDGADALKDFDGVVFLYAGDRYPTSNRGSLFWPHRASLTYKGKRWPYFICAEGGKRMGNISVFCHEFGHMLGLPDLYARPENPGSEGLGNWCAMSNQVGNGRPQHFGAWCKDQLGWLKPAVIDPTVPQKLVLGAVENSTSECFKILVRPDASEYLLLENRQKKGFDESIPAPGLLIWRVVGNRPILEESHGIEGPSGPRVFMSQVPYPSSANNSFTPYTTPSSRALLGGGLPVHITNIRHLPDGRITFHIGYEFQ